MSEVIWKYELPSPVTSILVPKTACVRHVGIDPASGNPAVWIQLDQTMPKVARTMRIHATGEPIDEGCTYHGTAYMPTSVGVLIWHVFERRDPRHDA